ncbi:hypothetical protein [Nostoc sp. TCL26-01]|uniref:hypothetical protein n=1 Tax=Nostoc sp. TCL26-01 TaxID=2576904 RepID=UPI0015B960C8|nr:hypothetical protein [Nostoc sp. TCL26-01]QLE55034.1 hypothetical protein FD725_05615 [Nostoc sp. TCL26-01]
MQHLYHLLTIQNSELARLLRFSLYGLETSLKKAQSEFPQDPGARVCDEVLQELQNLLQLEAAAVDITQTVEELKLNHLRYAFDADPELNLYLDSSPLQSQTDADLWNEIHRKLLRVPEDLATIWRQRALDLAQEMGAVADNAYVYPLPFIRNEIIYPGLNGSINAQGLSLSQTAFFHTSIIDDQASEELNLLAGFLLLWSKFIEIDPDLHHALKSVFSFDILSLHSKPDQRNQYIDALIDRFQRTKKAEENADTLLTLRNWIDVDEAINSLVFVPPAERYSWWGKLQQESRRALKKVADRAISAGHDVRIRQLTGIYADICALSKDDLQLDMGGIPGEVLSCLRVYARINQDEIPGRVIFRSSR